MVWVDEVDAERVGMVFVDLCEATLVVQIVVSINVAQDTHEAWYVISVTSLVSSIIDEIWIGRAVKCLRFDFLFPMPTTDLKLFQ
jgi:hypothetical protein